MTLRPASIDELREVVPGHSRLRLRGGGSKPGLSGTTPGRTVIDLSALAGVVEHTPEECTFTALAGTRLADIERLLAAHGQYLPFDPALVDRGATIAGTVSSGVNGSCRYRYGGVRDFLIGARIVDGHGRLVRSGGKVVKNAAGFLLHQAMVGSCGRFGALAELTFKVFPRAPAYATVIARAADLDAALSLMASVQRAGFDLEALDIESPATVSARLGGAGEALPQRVAALQHVIGESEVLVGEEDERVWRQAREFAWAPADALLVRVPLTPPQVPALDAALAPGGAVRRYALAGNVAFSSWPGHVNGLSAVLAALGLTGQVLWGASGSPFIGRSVANEFEKRVRAVMDPDGRFGPD